MSRFAVGKAPPGTISRRLDAKRIARTWFWVFLISVSEVRVAGWYLAIFLGMLLFEKLPEYIPNTNNS